VVNNGTDHSVSVFVNETATGATQLTLAMRRDFFVGGQPGTIAIGDLNGDGRPDLAATVGDTVCVLASD
jgi:hypothetical protein